MTKPAYVLLFATLFTGLGFAAAAPARAANEFYVTIQGQKQGKFRGESTKRGQEGKIVGLAYEYGVKSPRDASSGQATGKRQHSPITFSKEWGATTPQLFLALVNNETLTSVTFEFVRAGAKNGTDEIFQVVKLTNAQISSIAHHARAATDGKVTAGESPGLEDVSIVFEKIEIENRPAGISASDSLSGQAQ
jgi:type VI secretion system secreted protein Hcp